MNPVISIARNKLKESIDEKTIVTGQNFFKEKIKSYGVKVPVVHKISRELFVSVKNMPKEEIFTICEEFWRSGFLEESFIACNWSYYLHKNFEPSDFEIFKRWISKYVKNWASCDTFCNHTVGTFIEMYPAFLPRLKEMTKSKHRWMRRASAVSLIVPARKGKFLKEILEIADYLLHDKDDMVQKGYGWMLKVASKPHQMEIFNFVISRKETMPRTALRYAIEKMPEELKSKAMEKYGLSKIK